MPGKQAKELHVQGCKFRDQGAYTLVLDRRESLGNLRQVTQPLSFLSVKWGRLCRFIVGLNENMIETLPGT